MKSIFYILLLSLLYRSGLTQNRFDFQIDKKSDKVLPDFVRFLNEDEKNGFDFQIRFCRSFANQYLYDPKNFKKSEIPIKNDDSRDMLLLTYKNRIWNCYITSFQFNSDWVFVERKPVRKLDLDSLYKKLLLNDLLTLPNMSTIQRKFDEYKDSVSKHPSMDVLDGDSYMIELLSKKGTRSYSYFCPFLYVETFKINELKKATNLFSDFLKLMYLEELK